MKDNNKSKSLLFIYFGPLELNFGCKEVEITFKCNVATAQVTVSFYDIAFSWIFLQFLMFTKFKMTKHCLLNMQIYAMWCIWPALQRCELQDKNREFLRRRGKITPLTKTMQTLHLTLSSTDFLQTLVQERETSTVRSVVSWLNGSPSVLTLSLHFDHLGFVWSPNNHIHV